MSQYWDRELYKQFVEKKNKTEQSMIASIWTSSIGN